MLVFVSIWHFVKKCNSVSIAPSSQWQHSLSSLGSQVCLCLPLSNGHSLCAPSTSFSGSYQLLCFSSLCCDYVISFQSLMNFSLFWVIIWLFLIFWVWLPRGQLEFQKVKGEPASGPVGWGLLPMSNSWQTWAVKRFEAGLFFLIWFQNLIDLCWILRSKG